MVTAIKFLVEEGSYRYVMSGSLLGVELKDIRSMPAIVVLFLCWPHACLLLYLFLYLCESNIEFYMRVKEIPILLLTGYLGSGKTTLVNHILSNKRGIKFAVIVNDIGEVNIDADLIQKGGIVGKKDESLVALQNG